MFNFGGIEIIEQKGLSEMPQRAASAWTAMNTLLGATYKPIAYVGTQVVKGVNHFFIAEQTLITATAIRHIVLATINEFDGSYSVVNIDRII